MAAKPPIVLVPFGVLEGDILELLSADGDGSHAGGEFRRTFQVIGLAFEFAGHSIGSRVNCGQHDDCRVGRKATFVSCVLGLRERVRNLQIGLLDRHSLLCFAVKDIRFERSRIGIENDFEVCLFVADRHKGTVVRAFIRVMMSSMGFVIVVVVRMHCGRSRFFRLRCFAGTAG
jgi:hypothetical protein